MKRCKNCHNNKPINTFLPDSRTVDKKAKICTECRAKGVGLSVEEFETIWLDNALVQHGRYEQKRGCTERWVLSNREKQNRLSRDYQKRNPEMVAKHARNRRARKLAAGGTISEKEWEAKCFEYSNCCSYCGIYMEKPEMDHIVPLSLGGAHVIDNVVPACRSCNSKKGNKMIIVMKGMHE